MTTGARTTREDLRHGVMGTRAHIVVVDGPAGLAARLADRLDELEARWSRFRPDSELSRLGALDGEPAIVSPDTALLVHLATEAWHRTAGCFDPTVVDALVAAGYDRDRRELRSTRSSAVGSSDTGPVPPSPGCGGIEVDLVTNLVRLPPGVRLDPGGIGKGLAADLVVADALEGGAAGALVSVGGDLRVGGRVTTEGWEVAIDHPGAEESRVNLVVGGLATSSVDGRRWATPSGAAHHLIDPRTGRPATTAVRAVSVLAGTAWAAEVRATALLVGLGDGRVDAADLLEEGGALVTHADGSRERLGSSGDSFDLGDAT